MKFESAVSALIAPILLAACAGTSVGVRSGNSPSPGGSAPAPGSSYSTAAIQADLTPGAFFGLVFLGFLVSGVEDDKRRSSHGPTGRTPPEMAEDRAVVERDCSQPLGPLYANLRCR